MVILPFSDRAEAHLNDFFQKTTSIEPALVPITFPSNVKINGSGLMTIRDNEMQLEHGETTVANLALAKLLVKLGLVTQAQVLNAPNSGELAPIAQLSECGLLNEQDAIRRISAELSVPVFQINNTVERAILTLLDSPEFSQIESARWRQLRAVPIAADNSQVTIAVANPLDVDCKRNLEFALQRKVSLSIAPERAILGVLSQRLEGQDGLDFSSLLQTTTPAAIRNTSAESSTLESNVATEDIAAPTVVRIVNKIFASAVRQRASDIHITPQGNRLSVRIRVDGIARELMLIPQELSAPVVSRLKVLCGMDISEKRQPQDGRLRIKTNTGIRDLRISTVPTVYGEDVVARILESELRATTLDALGMPEAIKSAVGAAIKRSSKVFLVTGPTGSGKTSTLYTALLQVRDGTNRVITIEDPIEYRIPEISQIQVNTKVGMTFASALRSVLRQDPDIILLGEIRDSETASTAMQVAQTGHLVLSTLHTNTAAAAITRLRDLGVPSFLIGSSLGSVLAQRLVRKLCLACRKPASTEHASRYNRLGVDYREVYEPHGCDHCAGTGYVDRIGVFSFLDITPEIAQAVRTDKSEQELEALAADDGFQTLHQAGLELLSAGETSLFELERVLGSYEHAHLNTGHLPTDHLTNGPLPAAKVLSDHESEGIIPKRRVMVVDDDENVRTVFQALLEFEMFEVVQAENGQDALKKIYEKTPEVVLCDLMMPRMNGLELIEKLRSDVRTRALPVIVLTAASTEDNELKLIKGGADDFISKTCRPEVIVARINRLINRP